MHRRTVLAALAAGACTRTRAQTPAATTEAFDFVALGDMPYRPDAMVGPAYRHLIDLINGLAPPFSIHVGDFKDGLAACSDDEYQLQWRHFQRFASALVYTPGDNDWLDCNRRGDDHWSACRHFASASFPRRCRWASDPSRCNAKAP